MIKKDKNINSDESKAMIKAKKYYKLGNILGKAFLALSAATVLWFVGNTLSYSVTQSRYFTAVYTNPEYTEYVENESERLSNSYANEEISKDEYSELDRKLKNGHNDYLDKFYKNVADEDTKKDLEPLYKAKTVGTNLYKATIALASTAGIFYAGTAVFLCTSSKLEDKVKEEDERKKKLELIKLDDPDKDTVDLEVE